MITDQERREIETQIEQLTCFIKSVYAGMAHDIEVRWKFRGGTGAIGRVSLQEIADYWEKDYGKHQRIIIGVGDACYGSKSISGMLYQLAYDMRERLTEKLERDSKPRTLADLYDEERK